MERRTFDFNTGDFEVRAKQDGTGYTFRGHASVFNSWSQDLGGFVEQVAPTAFTRALKEGQNVRHMINHNPDMLLGTTKSGTTKLSLDERGLHVETDLPDTSYARNLIELQRRGDMTQMSFGFNVPKGGDSWDWSTSPAQRTLNDVNLADVSSVTYPAYTDTDSVVSQEVRSLVDEHRKDYTQAERDQMAKDGEAMPNGSYPIATTQDLKNAISTVGLGKAPEADIRDHIVKRAKALGASDLIPETWRSVEPDEVRTEIWSDDKELEERVGKVMSNASKAHVSAAMDHLQALMDADGDGTDDQDQSGDPESNSQPIDYFERRMLLAELGLFETGDN